MDEEGKSRPGITGWFIDRLKLAPLIEVLSGKGVPRHRYSFWYIWGGLALFFFGIQVLTGILLLLYYSPTPETAHESIQFIITQVPFGWLIRSIHSWCSNLMIAAVLVHMFSNFFLRAYRKPRELMWLSGVLLLFLVLGFGFTGYLLPWDVTAYFATQIGTEVPRSTPLIGDIVVRILRGGEYIAAESMKRLFALHVVVLPLIALALTLFHIILNQVHGSSVPIGVRESGRPIRFFPNYLYRDAIVWCTGLIVLFWLSLAFPVTLGPKADPFSSAPVGIKPEWYFLTLYQTLRMVPSTVAGLNGEMLVNICVFLLGLFLLALPFIDAASRKEHRSPLLTALGIAAIVYLGAAISLAYLT